MYRVYSTFCHGICRTVGRGTTPGAPRAYIFRAFHPQGQARAQMASHEIDTDPVSDPEEGLSWMTRLMMMLMMLPTAAPADAAAQGDWKERLERFNAAAASDESEDEVRLSGLPEPHAPWCVTADLAVPGRAGRPPTITTLRRVPRLPWIPAARARHCLPRRGQVHMKLISLVTGFVLEYCVALCVACVLQPARCRAVRLAPHLHLLSLASRVSRARSPLQSHVHSTRRAHARRSTLSPSAGL